MIFHIHRSKNLQVPKASPTPVLAENHSPNYTKPKPQIDILTTILNSNDAREDIDGSLLTAKSYFPSGIVYTPEGLFFSN
ncbi:MAG: hypothetical protein B7Y39_16305 [Bdellovibrio sp. 28-41-41]|nr:MAG: hypothetical protein B7Y39_16305 [Bdellovibrio sp. 28-41-41]